jgi:hypothetical protein
MFVGAGEECYTGKIMSNTGTTSSEQGQLERTQPDPVQSGESSRAGMVVVRKRKRRRNNATEINRTQLGLTIAIFALLIFVVASPNTRAAVKSAIRGSLPSAGSVPIEVVALGIAGLIILWLLPGVEHTVLTALGIRKEKRRNRPSSSRSDTTL